RVLISAFYAQHNSFA
ncbi:hypothetical protein SOJ30_02925, partial [Treponema pallidum]